MKHIRHILFSMVLLASFGFGSVLAQPTPKQRLATELTRASLSLAAMEPLTVQSIELCVLLIKEAIALSPDDLELWHITLELAQLAEDETLRRQALDAIARLDPSDEAVRLLRLNLALDKHQTVEARATALEHVLSEANVTRIGMPVASRLALDLALLYERQGDTKQFSNWLNKAIQWDPSNRSAAALATGFFRMNVQDPVAEAELLINLMYTDPTDVTTIVALSQLLLEHGAFSGAERMYRLAVDAMRKDKRSPANNLLADLCIAMWCNGHGDEALDLLHYRHVHMGDMFVNYLRATRPELSPAEIRELPVPADPTIMLVSAMIHFDRGSANAPEWFVRTVVAYDTLIADMEAQAAAAPSPEAAAEVLQSVPSMRLEQAWASLWLLGNVEKAAHCLELAKKGGPIGETAQRRFDGWMALRGGDLELAKKILQPIAGEDTAARAGLALAYQQSGQRRDAAAEYLAIGRAQPGSLIGRWAHVMFRELAGQPIPLDDQSRALNQLIASIPVQFDRSFDDTSLAVSFRVRPAKQTFEPFEPVLVTFELINQSGRPLAIDRNGPIRPHMLLLTGLRSANSRTMGNLRPFIVNAGRKLRLEPRERMSFTIDVRKYAPGDGMNMFALNGGILKLRAMLNFRISEVANPESGLWGLDAEVPLIRIDGRRWSDEWIKETTDKIAAAQGDEMIMEMALVSSPIASRIPFDAPTERRELIERCRTVWAEQFTKLSPAAQAWLIGMIPRGRWAEGVQHVVELSRQSQERLVQLAHLLFHVEESTNPMLDAGMRHDDPAVRRIAELIRVQILAAEAAYTGQGGQPQQPQR